MSQWRNRGVMIHTRKLHTVPRLPFTNVPGLFSAEAMNVAWSRHQADMLKRLSQSTVDTDNAARVPFHIVLNSARKHDSAHVFNYASQAHNNHLFFQTLAPSTGANQPSAALSKRIEKQFGNVENMLEEVKRVSDKVSGNGWVFLVETPQKNLEILASNNAGTPYHFARQQGVDLNAIYDEDAERAVVAAQELVAANTKNYNVCLLALNLWQHAYLTDFGVTGRSEYIDAWTKSINWSTVSSRLFGDTVA